jgi:hypothetical protein
MALRKVKESAIILYNYFRTNQFAAAGIAAAISIVAILALRQLIAEIMHVRAGTAINNDFKQAGENLLNYQREKDNLTVPSSENSEAVRKYNSDIAALRTAHKINEDETAKVKLTGKKNFITKFFTVFSGINGLQALANKAYYKADYAKATDLTAMFKIDKDGKNQYSHLEGKTKVGKEDNKEVKITNSYALRLLSKKENLAVISASK